LKSFDDLADFTGCDDAAAAMLIVRFFDTSVGDGSGGICGITAGSKPLESSGDGFFSFFDFLFFSRPWPLGVLLVVVP
jgi:hypothetical protein